MTDEYSDLLKRAYSNLPEKTEKVERLEIPTPVLMVEGNKTIIKNYEVIVNKLRRDPKHLANILFLQLNVRLI